MRCRAADSGLSSRSSGLSYCSTLQHPAGPSEGQVPGQVQVQVPGQVKVQVQGNVQGQVQVQGQVKSHEQTLLNLTCQVCCLGDGNLPRTGPMQCTIEIAVGVAVKYHICIGRTTFCLLLIQVYFQGSVCSSDMTTTSTKTQSIRWSTLVEGGPDRFCPEKKKNLK